MKMTSEMKLVKPQPTAVEQSMYESLKSLVINVVQFCFAKVVANVLSLKFPSLNLKVFLINPAFLCQEHTEPSQC